MSVTTGHGATITFATSTVTFPFTQITVGDQTVPDVDTSHLATPTHRTYISGDLIEPGEITIPMLWDDIQDYPPQKTSETITITFPQRVTGTPATMVGTGYIRDVTPPDFQTDTVNAGQIIVKWDGQTPPAYTKATET